MPFLVTYFAYLISASRLTVGALATNASLERYENSVFKASPNNERNRPSASEGLEWARPCHEGEPLINIILYCSRLASVANARPR